MAVDRALFSTEEVAVITGGEIRQGSRRPVSSVAIDSRQVTADALFIPLPGEHFDGHQFLTEALTNGASALLVADRVWPLEREEVARQARERGAALITVPDTLRALQDLAGNHMRSMTDLKSIAITGSSGKTTTKEILGSILRREGSAIINEGNLNSEIGLPLSVLKIKEEHKYAVLEMGMNHPGEMSVLADIVRPEVALITNIGRAHIGLLGSQERIAAEKKEIFKFFDNRQLAFLFEDEPFFEYLSSKVRGKIIPFGPRSTPGFEGSKDLGLAGSIIYWEGLQIHFPLFGAYNLLNALSSISVSVELGIRKSKIKLGLEEAKPIFGRSQIIRGAVTIIQDCYNANPDSIGRLLGFVRKLSWQGRKIMVLGSMLELGQDSVQAHRQMGREAGHSGLAALIFFGAETETAYSAALEAGFSGFCSWIADFKKLIQNLQDYLREGDLLVLKGSRAIELERLIPLLSMDRLEG
ncbi:MAG: UDP-N-acetylmuramoyl-tripeptide--D-alanyl-D-alanine ligase [Spirochaeta sp.]|nr:UDP-N-acetylmuramoyl-tripeptide--D-alanyl-D-alanine ligase [Spirochaeta sp.]